MAQRTEKTRIEWKTVLKKMEDFGTEADATRDRAVWMRKQDITMLFQPHWDHMAIRTQHAVSEAIDDRLESARKKIDVWKVKWNEGVERNELPQTGRRQQIQSTKGYQLTQEIIDTLPTAYVLLKIAQREEADQRWRFKIPREIFLRVCAGVGAIIDRRWWFARLKEFKEWAEKKWDNVDSPRQVAILDYLEGKIDLLRRGRACGDWKLDCPKLDDIKKLAEGKPVNPSSPYSVRRRGANEERPQVLKRQSRVPDPQSEPHAKRAQLSPSNPDFGSGRSHPHSSHDSMYLEADPSNAFPPHPHHEMPAQFDPNFLPESDYTASSFLAPEFGFFPPSSSTFPHTAPLAVPHQHPYTYDSSFLSGTIPPSANQVPHHLHTTPTQSHAGYRSEQPPFDASHLELNFPTDPMPFGYLPAQHFTQGGMEPSSNSFSRPSSVPRPLPLYHGVHRFESQPVENPPLSWRPLNPTHPHLPTTTHLDPRFNPYNDSRHFDSFDPDSFLDPSVNSLHAQDPHPHFY